MSTYHSYLGRLEVQTDGVSGAAGYNALTLIGDAQLDMNRPEARVPRRGTEWQSFLAGQIDGTITAQMTWDDADTVVAAIEAAFIGNTHIGVKFLDKASGTGITVDCLVTGYQHDQTEDGVQVVNLTMKPTYVDTNPAWA